MGKVVDFSRPHKPRKLYVTIEDCGGAAFTFQTNAEDFENQEAGQKVLLSACRAYVDHFDREEARDWYVWDEKLAAAHAALPWWRRIFS